MKRYALIVAVMMSCVNCCGFRYECKKDEIFYHMNTCELLLPIVMWNQLKFEKDVFSSFWNDCGHDVNLPSVLLKFESDNQFLVLISSISVFREMFPKLCTGYGKAIREQFEIRERNICVEGQNQKLFAYLKERYALWKQNHPVIEVDRQTNEHESWTNQLEFREL